MDKSGTHVIEGDLAGKVSEPAKKATRAKKSATLPAAAPALQSTAVVDPMRIIELAVQRGSSVDELERLMALQERFEKNQAEKAFYDALSRFKEMGIAVSKDGTVDYTPSGKPRTFYKHATLANVCNTIGPALSACGLSWRWETKREPAHEGADKIIVTCILSHVLGHSERTELYAFPDASGSKNSIQAIGSTVKYLQRYTLMAATGTSDTDDDDGLGADAPDNEGDSGGKKNSGGRPELPVCSDEYFDKLCMDIPDPENPGAIKRFGIKSLVERGENTVEATIAFISTKATLTEKQIKTIKGWKIK
jgi:ERF superfamily